MERAGWVATPANGRMNMTRVVSFAFIALVAIKAPAELTLIKANRLVWLAYPDSADAHDNLADAYQKDGQKGLARQDAEKALNILDPRRSCRSRTTSTASALPGFRAGRDNSP
jgi:hypothetical protein